ncbi:methyltransferase [Ammoniphilus oxalaticus]|uniref:tRNA 5-hydroxyuridine methyltransferase n=1 Tax=Ammoniphilus oxalaticus TaxID=66863 RepID=A0A419SJ19_9BACL|nr:O-methyltransferase [Ammoniphilus oxalaticus]RKD23946.1 methyltransferase [Ammoniphilus oxalaticus]
MIVYENINRYIEQMVPERNHLLNRLEQEAEQEKIPIIQLSSIQFIRTLLLSHRPKKILEIGAAIGYSTIWLAQAAPEAKITTIEIDQERSQRALLNFKEAGICDRVELVVGDAGDGLPEELRFDCLFLDAAKGQYKNYIDLYLPQLEVGGIIICDNILFKGLVAEEHVEHKRWAPMVKKIQAFNCYLVEHPRLETSFIPIGDGLTFSVKKGE